LKFEAVLFGMLGWRSKTLYVYFKPSADALGFVHSAWFFVAVLQD